MIQVILIHIILMECTHCKFLLMGNIPHVTSRDCLIDTSAYMYTLVKPNINLYLLWNSTLDNDQDIGTNYRDTKLWSCKI